MNEGEKNVVTRRRVTTFDACSGLAAIQAAAINLAPDQRAERAAEKGAQRAIATTGDLMTGKCAHAGTDNQTGRPIFAAAVVSTVVTAPHIAVAGDTARLVVPATIVVGAAGLTIFVTIAIITACFAAPFFAAILIAAAVFISAFRTILGPLAMGGCPTRRVCRSGGGGTDAGQG